MRPAYEVLVVEDEAVVVESVKRILAPEGFAVDAAGSSEEATHKLQQRDYGIILIDIVLPGISGLQLTELLRKSHPRVITITFSGLATRENVIESFRCGAFDFIPKPFSFEELLGAVQRAARLLRAATDGQQRGDKGGVTEPGPSPSRQELWRDYRFLGDHTWVRFEDDGSAVIGVDDAYGDALGPVDSAEFPGAFEQINQGSACVRLTTKDGLVHVVWCPLSGVVVESNAAVGQGAQGRSESGQQYRGPWLVRIWPQNQEEEAGNLKPYAG